MKFLVFDTETTGLPETRSTSILDTKKWPHIVQLSWILYDDDAKKVLNCQDHIIKCQIDIPEASTKIHGITNEIANQKGVLIGYAIDLFNNDIKSADMIIAHNISFDKRVCMVESIRLNRRQYFTTNGVRKPEYCTMKETKDFCNIEKISMKGATYVKYPTLVELHNKLFGVEPLGVHNSMIDVLICLRCHLYFTQKIDIIKMDTELGKMYASACVATIHN